MFGKVGDFVSFIVATCIVCLFFVSVQAYRLDVHYINSTFLEVNVSNITNLYGYDITFNYSSSIGTVTSANFLGSGAQATYGTNISAGKASIYGSRLNSTGTGVNGTGRLFNMSFTGAVNLWYTIITYNNSTSEISYYNSSYLLTGCSVLSTANQEYRIINSIPMTGEGTCFDITASNVTLNMSGYTITGDALPRTTAVKIESGVNTTRIVNGVIRNFEQGIYGSELTNVTIDRMAITSSGAFNDESIDPLVGIYLTTSQFLSITNTRVENISTTLVDGVSRNPIGFYFTYSNYTRIENCSFSNIQGNSDLNPDQGIGIVGSQLTHGFVSNINTTNCSSGGVQLGAGANYTIQHIFVMQSGGNGFSFGDFINSTITDIISISNGGAVQFYNLNSSSVSGIQMSNSYSGLELSGPFPDTTISNFTVTNFSSYGLYLGSFAAHGSVMNGTLNGSGPGIFLDGGNRLFNYTFSNITIIPWNTTSYDLWLNPQGAGNWVNGPVFENMIIGNYRTTGNITLVLRKSAFGEIRFLQSINGTGNLSSDVQIGQNFAQINSSQTGLNVSANVTLYNTPGAGLTYPVIGRNGVTCSSSICRNFTALTASTVVFNVTGWSNYTIQEGNSLGAFSVSINSTDGSNKTLSHLNCFATLSDPDGDRMNVSVQWARNSSLYLSTTYNNNYANGTLFNATLPHQNTTKGEFWNCSIRVFDGTSFNSWANSTTLLILNSAPVVTLSTPADANSITNRAPLFNWSASDDDGDTLRYEINMTAYKLSGSYVCSDAIYNATGGANFTPASPLRCLYDNGYQYNWSVRANDTESWGAWSTQYRFNVTALLDIVLQNPSLDFGTVTIFSVNDTTDDSPAPLVLENRGNTLISVNVTGSSLWASAPNPTSYYQFKADNYTGHAGAFNWSASITSFSNFTGSSQTLLQGFNYAASLNRSEIDIRIEVPANEPPAVRNATVQLFAQLGE